MQRIPKDSCTALNCPESQQIPLSHSCCKVCKGKVISGYTQLWWCFPFLQVIETYFPYHFEEDTPVHNDLGILCVILGS